jgi:SAM-dependent methyltransferase
MPDYKKLVKNGYNAIAAEYLTTRNDTSEDIQLLHELIQRLPKEAKVLDAGCGAGIPVAKILSEYFDIVGVDFSEEQIKLAKKHVPQAKFVCHDIVTSDFPNDSFDGICSYYAIIHIPREEHAKLFQNFHRMLKPGGFALLCLGADDLKEDYVEDYHGSPMYWSHFDAPTNIKMLEEAGFEILQSKLVTDSTYPASKHLFVLGKKK